MLFLVPKLPPINPREYIHIRSGSKIIDVRCVHRLVVNGQTMSRVSITKCFSTVQLKAGIKLMAGGTKDLFYKIYPFLFVICCAGLSSAHV